MINFVGFPTYKVVEPSNARAYSARVTPWLVRREAENCTFLTHLPDLVNGMGVACPRLFTVEEHGQICAAAIYHPSGKMILTWAVPDAISALVDDMAKKDLQPSAVYGPHHVSIDFSEAWTKRAGGSFECGREERVLQLADLTHTPPAAGRLEVATPADAGFLRGWVEQFAREAEYEQGGFTLEQILDDMISHKQLHVWKNPEPVGMAAMARSSPHGAPINFVFVPPEFRGRGHGRDLTAAMAQKVFSQGLRYCFILTDAADTRTKHIYFSIGARTVSVFLRCEIYAPERRLQARPGGARYQVTMQ